MTCHLPSRAAFRRDFIYKKWWQVGLVRGLQSATSRSECFASKKSSGRRSWWRLQGDREGAGPAPTLLPHPEPHFYAGVQASVTPSQLCASSLVPGGVWERAVPGGTPSSQHPRGGGGGHAHGASAVYINVRVTKCVSHKCGKREPSTHGRWAGVASPGGPDCCSTGALAGTSPSR